MRGAPALALVAALLCAPARAGEEKVVALVPFGPVDDRLVEVARAAIERRLRVAVGIEPRRELPRAARASARRRWRAEKILEALQEDPPPGAFKVVAMTDAEISTTKGDIPDWRVAGLGNIGGLACVTSMWINLRHSATRATLERRTADLVIHELGHTLGLPHCETPRCVMRDAKGRYLETADSSSGDFCDRCKASLPADLLRR